MNLYYKKAFNISYYNRYKYSKHTHTHTQIWGNLDNDYLSSWVVNYLSSRGD